MEKYYVKCGIRERSFKFDGNRKELRQLIFTLLSFEFGELDIREGVVLYYASGPGTNNASTFQMKG
jgi:hypothetical protein